MDNQTLEAAGYICRWLLLAAVGCIMAVFAWAAGQAVSAASVGEPIEVTLSDAVCRPLQEPMLATGTILPRGKVVSVAQVYAVKPGPGAWLVYSGDDMVFPTIRDKTDPTPYPADRLPREGLAYTSAVRGVPYGACAFDEAESLVVVLPPSAEVFAIDVRLLDVADKDGRQLDQAVELLRGRGQVAFFDAGLPGRGEREQTARYRSLRREVRTRFGALPAVFSLDRRYGEVSVLVNQAWTLGWRQAKLPMVITGSHDLAVAASREGFDTHLVGPAQRFPDGNVKVHGSLEAFSTWIRGN